MSRLPQIRTHTFVYISATLALIASATYLRTAGPSAPAIVGWLLSVGVPIGAVWAIYRGSQMQATATIRGSLGRASEMGEPILQAASSASVSGKTMADASAAQAQRIKETATALFEVAQSAQRNSSNSEHAHTISNEVQRLTDSGQEAMKTMSEIVSQIGKAANKTSSVIKTIDAIAFQTNLLALNAAVEAARAGDAGRGFSVVAEEVRSLAQRSSQAAAETTETLRQSAELAKSGAQAAERVQQCLSSITTAASKAKIVVEEIAGNSAQQSSQLASISRIVEQLDYLLEQNTASSQSAAIASEMLAEQLQRMFAELGTSVQPAATETRGAKPADRSPSFDELMSGSDLIDSSMMVRSRFGGDETSCDANGF